jgi:hypothetical protein
VEDRLRLRAPPARRKPAPWPRVASLSLSVTLVLSVCVLIWANERTATNLVAAPLCLVSAFLLSRLRK